MAVVPEMQVDVTVKVKSANKWKKALYIFYIPLLLLEWFADMLVNLAKVVHNSIETLTLVLQNKINEPFSEEPDTEKADITATANGQQLQPGHNLRRQPDANDRRAVSRVRR